MPRGGIAESYGRCIFSFWRILHSDFHSGWYQFAIPPEVKKHAPFAASSPALVGHLLKIIKY